MLTSSLNPNSLSARSVPPAARVAHRSRWSCTLAESFSRRLALSLVTVLPSRKLCCDGLRDSWILTGREDAKPSTFEPVAWPLSSVRSFSLLLPNHRRRRGLGGVVGARLISFSFFSSRALAVETVRSEVFVSSCTSTSSASRYHLRRRV